MPDAVNRKLSLLVEDKPSTFQHYYQTTAYQINGKSVTRVDEIRDSGVGVDSRMNFVTSNGFQMVVFIKTY